MASPSVTSNAMSIILGSTCLRRPSADGSVAAHCAADFLHHADGGEGRRKAVKEGEGRVKGRRVSRPEGRA